MFFSKNAFLTHIFLFIYISEKFMYLISMIKLGFSIIQIFYKESLYVWFVKNVILALTSCENY